MFKSVRLPKKIRTILWLAGLISIVIYTIFFATPQQTLKPEITNTLGEATATSSAVVTRVIDGDTIEVLLEGKKQKIRLIGINTPETVDPRKPVECYGKEASTQLKKRIAGKTVRLEADLSQSNADKYKRLLRYIFIEEVSINEQMIKEGYAYEYTYDLPYRYQEQFKKAQQEAQQNNRGLWNPQICVQ